MYLVHTPWWLRALYPSLVWRMPVGEKVIYLSFDDGPHAQATPFVLDQLKNYGAKASFFCIGKNVVSHPHLYERILAEGHAVGNHTYQHVNGWRTANEHYFSEVRQTAAVVQSGLFRPPYGRITRAQASQLQSEKYGMKVIMWDVLSGDFDTAISGERCLANVLKHTRDGSIVVFHDSAKAWDRMSYALPAVLAHFSGQGYVFRALEMNG